MEILVELNTGETLSGFLVDEDDTHIFLKWSNGKKVSLLAKEIIKRITFVDIELY